jgi:hypothetical protein
MRFIRRLLFVTRLVQQRYTSVFKQSIVPYTVEDIIRWGINVARMEEDYSPTVGLAVSSERKP